MSVIIEAPKPSELLTELREEARSLPKNREDALLSRTRTVLAGWIRELHNPNGLGGLYEADRDTYNIKNLSMARRYSGSKIETVSLHKERNVF